jgi:class 3 adenylate cyclase/predicted ATPase/DNA-binding transcriptional ArsR family regulator
MNCRQCGSANPADNKFCSNCGTRLLAICGQCKTSNPPNAKFCAECGTSLHDAAQDSEAAPAATIAWLSKDAEVERRQLTILFCDLVGVTALASTLDPEDLREIINAYHACARDIVERHSGFIAQYLGDGILVYFGYPHASEDDAERAVRAGLELTEAVGRVHSHGTLLSSRVGIATGVTVVSDLIGSHGEHERSALGETPNLAARLQAVAAPGTVVIAPLTRRLIGELFEYRELGAVELKGFAQPVQATQVIAERKLESRFQSLRPGQTTLIGREMEYETLQRLWQAASEGRGQAALILGEPGIGKSRLVAAIEEHVTAGRHLKLRFVCSPQHTGSALRPVINRIEWLAGFAQSDTPDQKLDKLATMLLPTSPAPDDLELIAELLSLPATRRPTPTMPPQQRRALTLAALSRQLQSRAKSAPVMVVWDDVHWIDATSQSLLDDLVRQITKLPILLVITSRPGFLPAWHDQPQVTSLVLERLTGHEIASLATHVAGGKALPPELMEQIIARTDGVPLFVEELTKTMIESGLLQEESGRYVLTGALPAMAVPSTLQASLMARLDRLGSIRDIAQIGAAIGREFSFELLAVVTGLNRPTLNGALARLRDAELVYLREDGPETTYTFKHALVQNAAYSTLIRDKRRVIHAQIAAALETHFTHTVDAQPEVLAQHFENAEISTKAIDYYQRAATLALGRCAATEAARHVGKGLKLLTLVPEGDPIVPRELALQLSLGRAMILLHGEFADQTGAAFLRARDLCQAAGHTDLLFEVLDGLSVHHFSRRELDRTIAVSQELLALGEQEGQRKITITGLRPFASASFLVGKFAESRESFQRLLGLYRPELDTDLAARTRVDPQVSGLSYLSLVVLIEGMMEQSIAYSQQSIRAARSRTDPASIGFALRLAAFRSALVADWPVMLEFSGEWIVEAEKLRLPLHSSEAKFFKDWASFQLAQGGDGIAGMRDSLHAFSAGRPVWPFFLAAVATAEASAGNHAEAETVFAQALAIADAHGERWNEAEIIRQRAEARLNAPQPCYELIEREFRTSFDIARAQGAKLWQLRAAVSLARLWNRQGRSAEAHALVRPIYADFREGLNSPDLLAAREFVPPAAMVGGETTRRVGYAREQ